MKQLPLAIGAIGAGPEQSFDSYVPGANGAARAGLAGCGSRVSADLLDDWDDNARLELKRMGACNTSPIVLDLDGDGILDLFDEDTDGDSYDDERERVAGAVGDIETREALLRQEGFDLERDEDFILDNQHVSGLPVLGHSPQPS